MHAFLGFSFFCRDLDAQMASLKAANNDLELRNEMLMQANGELKAHIGVVSTSSLPPEPDEPVESSSASSLNGGTGGALSVSVNLVTNIPATTTITTGTSTVGVASAAIPLRFDSQYRRSMESGLQ
jgi:hypothetical protein